MKTRPSVHATVTHSFPVPPNQIYDAWLQRELIGQWMFGPAVRDEEILHLAVDPRVGGAFSFLVERDGEKIEHIGRYLELDRPNRLAFTWMIAGENGGSRVIVDIRAAATGCELTLTHELHPSWADFREASEQAWSHMLDVLERVVAAPSAPVSPRRASGRSDRA